MFAFLQKAVCENLTKFFSFSKQLLLKEQKYVAGFSENANTFMSTCECNCPVLFAASLCVSDYSKNYFLK